MNKLILALSLFILVGIGCKSKKATMPAKSDMTTAIKPSELSAKQYFFNQFNSAQNNFDYYHSTGKATYSDGDNKIELDVQITMEKNSYIMITASALLGIEVARILITHDSISMLDRLKREHTVAQFDLVKTVTKVELGLENLQEFLIGNPPFETDIEKAYPDTMLNYIVFAHVISQEWKQLVYASLQNLKTQRIILGDRLSKNEMKVEFDEFYTKAPSPYPSSININIRAEKNIACKIQLTYFAFDKKKELNFVVPKSYKTIRM
jgi:hypothetical protein